MYIDWNEIPQFQGKNCHLMDSNKKKIYNHPAIFLNHNKYRYILILRCNRFLKIHGETICAWIHKYLRKMYIVEKSFLKYINHLEKKNKQKTQIVVLGQK